MKRLLSLTLFRIGCFVELLGTPRHLKADTKRNQQREYRALRDRWELGQPSIQKIEAHAALLLRRDGWCLGPWRGWRPEFDRDKSMYMKMYIIRIGPAQLVINFCR